MIINSKHMIKTGKQSIQPESLFMKQLHHICRLLPLTVWYFYNSNFDHPITHDVFLTLVNDLPNQVFAINNHHLLNY